MNNQATWLSLSAPEMGLFGSNAERELYPTANSASPLNFTDVCSIVHLYVGFRQLTMLQPQHMEFLGLMVGALFRSGMILDVPFARFFLMQLMGKVILFGFVCNSCVDFRSSTIDSIDE